MNDGDRLQVHVDGLIYARQSHGGISRNFTNLVNALSARSDVVVRLYLEPGVGHPSGMAPVTTVRLPETFTLRPERLLGGIGRRWDARRRRHFWQGLSRGVFHSTYYSAPDGVEVPGILTMQDTIFEDFPELFNLPRHRQHLADKVRAAAHCSAFIFSSQFARKRTEIHYELLGRPALVSPYAIDPIFRRTPDAVEVDGFRDRTLGNRPFLLHVGSRHAHKNVGRLLKAYSVWSGRGNYSLLLAGGGELSNEEEALVEECELGERLVVVPRLGESDLLLAYHAATALIFPSLSEGFGFPVIEALACACPVACSRAASLPELGQEYAVYFDPANIDSMIEALDLVVDRSADSTHWLEAQQMARQRGWDHVADDYVGFYRKIMAEAGTN